MDGCLLFVMFIMKLCDTNKQAVQALRRTTKKSLGRLDLLECSVLEPDEYDKRAAKGLCPPQPTKMLKTFGNKLKKLYPGKSFWLMKEKQKKKEKDRTMKKRLIMRAVFLGKQSFYELRLQNVDFDIEFIEGLFLILECPTRKKIKKIKDLPNIEWYLDGSPVITDSRLSWRVKLTPLKYLQEGLGRGTANYIITMMLSIPFVTFAIFYRLFHPQREAIVLESSVVDFYSKLLDLTTEEMKSNIIKTVYKDKMEIKRKEIESTYSSQKTLSGGRMRNNRDTVMTIVKVAEINQRKNYSATNKK